MSSLASLTTSPDMQPLEDYCFSPRAKEIYKMEYYWGLSRGELELESALNRITVRADVKKLLEQEQYALIPTQDTLQILYDLHDCNQERAHDDRRVFTEVLPIGEYNYHLVPTSASSPSIQSTDCSTPSSKSTQLFVRSYVHPALVIAATYPMFNRFPLLGRNRWISSISSFYLLQLPTFARNLAEWRPHNDKVHPETGGSPTRRQRARRSLEIEQADAPVGERLPLMTGLPETLPRIERRVQMVYCQFDISLAVLNDIDIGEYAYEPAPAAADVFECGDDWKSVARKRLAANRNRMSPKKEVRRRWNFSLKSQKLSPF
ncbi:hypothetical protein CPB85DRAFT_260438 [Mucidula mucida]|nr:hypothetical protein CPB85DRAFT_260438 [Mucidula mucida]